MNFKETLNISLHYFKIPVTLSFRQPLNKKTSLLFSGGMRIRGLLYAKDNYQDILFWTVALNGMKYRRVFVVPYTSVSIQKQLFGIHKSEVGIFVSRDLYPWHEKTGAFMRTCIPLEYYNLECTSSLLSTDISSI
jgi:hypothetical protein